MNNIKKANTTDFSCKINGAYENDNMYLTSLIEKEIESYKGDCVTTLAKAIDKAVDMCYKHKKDKRIMFMDIVLE